MNSFGYQSLTPASCCSAQALTRLSFEKTLLITKRSYSQLFIKNLYVQNFEDFQKRKQFFFIQKKEKN
ncbi:hypothetical protein pb186bvf_004290 [Paramecium bursaria]